MTETLNSTKVAHCAFERRHLCCVAPGFSGAFSPCALFWSRSAFGYVMVAQQEVKEEPEEPEEPCPQVELTAEDKATPR